MKKKSQMTDKISWKHFRVDLDTCIEHYDTWKNINKLTEPSMVYYFVLLKTSLKYWYIPFFMEGKRNVNRLLFRSNSCCKDLDLLTWGEESTNHYLHVASLVYLRYGQRLYFCKMICPKCWGVFTCSILASIVVILTSIVPILENVFTCKCNTCEYCHNTCKFWSNFE